MFTKAIKFAQTSLRVLPKTHSLRQQNLLQIRSFSTASSTTASSKIGNTSQAGSKKITTKTLCDITGTRYYEHNEEINFPADKVVRVYDENDQVIGDMKFGEAFSQAAALKKDIVLRNIKTDPPITKIMNYKLELLKRLFKKLGKDVNKKEEKTKNIRLTTTITVHDLENKRRKSIEFLKQYNTLKFFMKVNIYDQENVQKGRLMLLNIAENLKEYAKIKVSPVEEKPEKPAKGEQKPKSMDSIKEMAEKQQAFVKLDSAEIDDETFEEDGERASYLFMELESTSSFKDIDIDKMLEHTTMDDFMRGLYTSHTETANDNNQAKNVNVMTALMTGRGLDDMNNKQSKPELNFGEQENSEAQADQLRQKALQSLRDRRLRLKSSAIFNASEVSKKRSSRFASEVDDDMADVSDADKSDQENNSLLQTEKKREVIDLTAQQAQSGAENIGGLDEMDDFDLLEATIDPMDIKTQERVRQLEEEIEYEKAFIAIKMAYKFSMTVEDPMKISE